MNSHFEAEKQKLMMEDDTPRISINEGNLSSNQDDVSNLKRKAILQNNIIKSYDGWIHLLINIVNENNKKEHNNPRNQYSHYDFTTSIEKVKSQIKQGLEKIEQISQYNLDLKKKYLIELKKYINLMLRKEDNKKKIEKLQNHYTIIKEDIASNNEDLLKKEKMQLLETVNSISEEVRL